MGKNKNNKQNKKKNNNNKKNEAPNEERLDSTLTSKEFLNEWKSLISGLETASPPSSGDTAAAASAGNQVDVSLEGMNLNEAGREKRSPIGWKDVRGWWDGQCLPINTMTNSFVHQGLSPARAFMAAYQQLQAEDEREFQVRKDKMAETAREYGVKPLLDKSERKQRAADYTPLVTDCEGYTEEDYKSVAQAWKVAQNTRLLSGTFNNPLGCGASVDGLRTLADALKRQHPTEERVQQPRPFELLLQHLQQQVPGPAPRSSNSNGTTEGSVQQSRPMQQPRLVQQQVPDPASRPSNSNGTIERSVQQPRQMQQPRPVQQQVPGPASRPSNFNAPTSADGTTEGKMQLPRLLQHVPDFEFNRENPFRGPDPHPLIYYDTTEGRVQLPRLLQPLQQVPGPASRPSNSNVPASADGITEGRVQLPRLLQPQQQVTGPSPSNSKGTTEGRVQQPRPVQQSRPVQQPEQQIPGPSAPRPSNSNGSACAVCTTEGRVQQPRPMLQPQQQQVPGPSNPAASLPAVSSKSGLPPVKNPNEYLRINLFCHDDKYTVIDVKWVTQLRKLKMNGRIRNKVIDEISQKLGRTPTNLVFRYKGKNIRDTDTPRSLGMVNDDKIQVIEGPPLRRH